MNGFVETTRRKVGLNVSIDGLGMMLVKPQVQFLQLLRREGAYCAFNFQDCV
jgi:hypothetical protein